MAARVVWQGLADLQITLRNLPADLTGVAANQATANANGAAVDIRNGYTGHVVTGALRDGVQVEVIEAGPFRTGRRVVNRAPHAHLFESGTVARHYITVNGVTKSVGAMPAFRIFVPRIIRWRRRFLEFLRLELLRRGASRVSG